MMFQVSIDGPVVTVTTSPRPEHVPDGGDGRADRPVLRAANIERESLGFLEVESSSLSFFLRVCHSSFSGASCCVYSNIAFHRCPTPLQLTNPNTPFPARDRAGARFGVLPNTNPYFSVRGRLRSRRAPRK